MAYSTEFLATQSRKQLQSLAKENFIKANSTNADIILALQSVGSDCAEVSAVVVALDTSNISKVEANSPESKPREGCNEINVKEEILVGSHVEVLIENCWIQAVVRKINPKTYRISMSLDRSEQLTKHGNVRMLQLTATSLPVAKSAIVDAPDTELCGTVDLNLQKVEQSRPEENSEKRKRSSSNTSRVTNGSVSSANEDKAPLSKKRSFVAITSNKQQPQQAISVILQQEKRRTISSNAPLNYLPRPSVLPKATKPQHIQQDSLLTLQGKATALKSASSNAITTKAVRRDSCTPHNKIMDSAPRPQFQKKTISRLSVSRSEQIKSLQNIESTTVSASSSTAVVFSTSTPSKLKNGVPDFQKMHQRMMSNLKPITAIVKRNEIVDSKMTVAMVDAHKSTPSVSLSGPRSMGSAQIKTIVSSESKGTPSTTAAFFKARSMPNFKALHEKISSKIGGTPSGDKENSIAAVNDATESKRRMSGKGAKNILVESKKSDRKENFLQGNKSMRAAKISASRKSGPFTSTKI